MVKMCPKIIGGTCPRIIWFKNGTLNFASPSVFIITCHLRSSKTESDVGQNGPPAAVPPFGQI